MMFKVVKVCGKCKSLSGDEIDGTCHHEGARGDVVGILLTLYPVLEPLVVLSCVTSYGEALKMYLGVLTCTSNRRSSVLAIKF
ncbi:hypothetical protein Q1695_014020 [Nippostrongylus brasiliensis]|nr:hypothetical protein Q1695_014020 [Nippostrongylus brasiliensis]